MCQLKSFFFFFSSIISNGILIKYLPSFQIRVWILKHLLWIFLKLKKYLIMTQYYLIFFFNF
jgi:hypothetical protein